MGSFYSIIVSERGRDASLVSESSEVSLVSWVHFMSESSEVSLVNERGWIHFVRAVRSLW